MMELDRKNPVVTKYADIDLKGARATCKIPIKEFVLPDLRERFNSAMLFTADSERLCEQGVLVPLKKVAGEIGFSFLLAGRDFPLHSTVLEGVEKDPSLRGSKFAKLTEDSELSKILEPLVGREIEYRYLLRAGGNTLILAALDIPPTVIEARQKISALYQKTGLSPLPMDNILHITVARVVGLPEKDVDERLKKQSPWNQRVTALRHRISKAPLSLRVAAVGNLLRDGAIVSDPKIFVGTFPNQG